MSIFEAYKQEFSSLQKEIRKNIDEFRDCDVESGFTTKDRQVEALLAQANAPKKAVNTLVSNVMENQWDPTFFLVQGGGYRYKNI